jgi:Sortase and related acyltransferases
MNIRNASRHDAPRIAAIYNYYVLNSTITFETESLSADEMEQRITHTQAASLPWLVAEKNQEVIGYAYASLWKTRAAYRHTVEVSVYLDLEKHSQGIGSKLLQALIDALPDHVHAIVACIALPNEKSVHMNERLGFRKVAEFKEVGFKQEQWIDVGYWQLLR